MDLKTYHEVKSAIDIGRKSIYDFDLRVAYYTRVSTSTDEQLNSLKNQKQVFEEMIGKQPNWTLVDGYIDEGISGVSAKRRPAFLKMIKDALAGKIDLIITKEVSRFARNTVDTLKYVDDLRQVGVIVYFQSDNIYSIDKDGELRLSIMASLAQEESRKISERTKWGKKQAVKNRVVICSNRFWGYEKDGKGLKIVEEEAEMVRLIFELYISGLGFRRISDVLTEKGYKNHNGKPFNVTSLKGILTNEKYAGYYTAHKQETIDFKTKQRVYYDRQDWEIEYTPDLIPPIVSIETYEQAQRILKVKSDKAKSNECTYQNSYLYSGKIKCKEHGESYWRTVYKYKSGDREVWHCKTYRQKGKKGCSSSILYKDELDIILKVILKELGINNYASINQLMKIYESIIKETDYSENINQFINKQNALIHKKERLLELNLDGVISKEEFKKRNESLSWEIEQINNQIEEYKILNIERYGYTEQLEKIKMFLDDSLNFSDKEIPDIIVSRYLEEIVVYQGTDVEISLYIKLRNSRSACVFYNRKNVRYMRVLQGMHIIKTDIETEISPIVGTEKQSEEFIKYFMEEFENNPQKIWESNMFGKSLYDMVKEELQGKLYKMPEDIQSKLQLTLQKVVNDNKGSLICIII